MRSSGPGGERRCRLRPIMPRGVAGRGRPLRLPTGNLRGLRCAGDRRLRPSIPPPPPRRTPRRTPLPEALVARLLRHAVVGPRAERRETVARSRAGRRPRCRSRREADVDSAFAMARRAQRGWAARSPRERARGAAALPRPRARAAGRGASTSRRPRPARRAATRSRSCSTARSTRGTTPGSALRCSRRRSAWASSWRSPRPSSTTTPRASWASSRRGTTRSRSRSATRCPRCSRATRSCCAPTSRRR